MGNASRRARAAVAEAAKRAKAAKETPQPEPELKLLTGPKTHDVQFLKDTAIEYPELFIDVHIVGSDILLAEFFAKARCRKSDTLKGADLVVFTGGPDVNPNLYNVDVKDSHVRTNFKTERDAADMKIYADARKLRIPMLGICRGAQFLHVMNGGTLYQDVDGHHGAHSMTTFQNVIIPNVSSTHHQMCMHNERMEVLGTARKSTDRWINRTEVEHGDNNDIEAFFYPETVCLGVQGHPEYRGYPRFSCWVTEMIRDKIIHNPRVGLENANYRIKHDVVIR